MAILTRFIAAVAATLCLAVPAQASLVVDATFTAGFTPSFAPGSFTGTDSNMDGILEFSELTDFLWEGTLIGDIDAPFSQLVSFGDYDYTSNNWSQAPLVGTFGVGFFSWNRFGNLDTTNAIGDRTGSTLVSISSSATPVPAPIPLALLGIGLLAIGLSRKGRK